MKTLAKTFLIATTAALAASSTFAQINPPFTNSSAFFNAITASNYTETYSTNRFSYQGQTNSPLSFSNSGFSYNAIAGAGNFYFPGTTNPPTTDLWLSVYDPVSITFTNFSANISAFGGNFFVTDSSGALTNVSITLTANFASGSPFTTNYTASTIDSFLGLTFNTNLTSVVLSATNGQYPTINNLTVGVVPEPSTYALLGLAAAGFAGYVIRRRRA